MIQLAEEVFIKSIRRDHPIRVLFVWPFTGEGENHAEVISALTSLPLKKRLSVNI